MDLFALFWFGMFGTVCLCSLCHICWKCGRIRTINDENDSIGSDPIHYIDTTPSHHGNGVSNDDVMSSIPCSSVEYHRHRPTIGRILKQKSIEIDPQTFEDTNKGKNLTRYKNAKDMFDKLGI